MFFMQKYWHGWVHIRRSLCGNTDILKYRYYTDHHMLHSPLHDKDYHHLLYLLRCTIDTGAHKYIVAEKICKHVCVWLVLISPPHWGNALGYKFQAPLHPWLGVVQFSVRVSQSFRRKDFGGWVCQKNLSGRIVRSLKPVHFKNVKFMIWGGPENN